MADDPIDSLGGNPTIKMSDSQRPTSEASEQPLGVGTLLDGRYLILRELGRGGFSWVYLASDEKVLSKKVVVKVLQDKRAQNEWSVRKFKQEIEALTRIDHPSVVGVFDFGKLASGNPYIVMRYVDGVTLRSCINSDGMDIKRVARLTKLLGAALAAAHEKGILHRDLKPENIMLSGDDEQLTIIDFGVAKVENSVIAASTVEPHVSGTYLYMSPEQLRCQPLSTASDIYSMGIIIYEMLTGRRPFHPETVAILAEMQREGVKITPKALRPALPDRAQDLILKTLSFATTDRPIDAHKFAAELEASLNEPDQLAVKESDTARFEKNPANKRASPATQIASWKLRIAGIVLLLAVIVSAVIAWNTFSPNTVTLESIAVLPFDFRSANADAEYISGGITDNLIDELSRIPSMKKVIAHASVVGYGGRSVDPLVVGRELDVQALLLGKITQQGENITIRAELVSTQDKRYIWGKTYRFRITDLLANQIEISRTMVASLQLLLTGNEHPRSNMYPENNAAYSLYLQGRNFWSKNDMYRAAECFRRAIDKDPNFALAYSGLADSYSLMDDRPPNEAMPQAKAAAIRALEIDDTLAEAHTSLALVLFRYDWNWAAAEAELKRAIQLNPNYGTAHQLYGSFLLASERPDEALIQINRAREVDPLSVVVSRGLGTFFLFTRQYDKAIEQYQKTLALDPNAAVHGYLRLAYQEQGKFDEAFQETQKSLASRLTGEQMEKLRQAYAASGYKGMRTMELRLIKETKDQNLSASELARLYASVGEKDEAFAWLDKAYESRTDALIWIKVDPRYDSLRSDPRFLSLLKRVGFANNKELHQAQVF